MKESSTSKRAPSARPRSSAPKKRSSNATRSRQAPKKSSRGTRKPQQEPSKRGGLGILWPFGRRRSKQTALRNASSQQRVRDPKSPKVLKALPGEGGGRIPAARLPSEKAQGGKRTPQSASAKPRNAQNKARRASAPARVAPPKIQRASKPTPTVREVMDSIFWD